MPMLALHFLSYFILIFISLVCNIAWQKSETIISISMQRLTCNLLRSLFYVFTINTTSYEIEATEFNKRTLASIALLHDMKIYWKASRELSALVYVSVCFSSSVANTQTEADKPVLRYRCEHSRPLNAIELNLKCVESSALVVIGEICIVRRCFHEILMYWYNLTLSW